MLMDDIAKARVACIRKIKGVLPQNREECQIQPWNIPMTSYPAELINSAHRGMI